MIKVYLRALMVAKQRPALLTAGIIEHFDRMSLPVISDIMTCSKTGQLPSEQKLLTRKRTLNHRYHQHLAKSDSVPAAKRQCRHEPEQFDTDMEFEVVDEAFCSDVDDDESKNKTKN